MAKRELNKVYMTQKELGTVFGFGRDYVHSRVVEIRDKSGKRYKYPFCGRNVHAGVFADWCANRRMLLDKNAAKYVPPFNPFDALDYTYVDYSAPVEDVKERTSNGYIRLGRPGAASSAGHRRN